MILSKRPDIERFLAKPDPKVRAILIYGRDMGVVRDRANALAAKSVERPDDPFDVALLTDGDLDSDGGRLEGELAAQSLMGGRRLVRLKLSVEKASLDRQAAEALTAHAEGRLNPDAVFIVEAGNLGRDSALRKAAEKAENAAAIPCYEDEPGDVARLVRETLASDGVALDAPALQLFVSRLPRERGVARQEIERLALYLGPGSGRTASAADLEDFLGVEPEASLSDAAADAFGGRLAEAQAALRRARAEGEAGPAAVRAIGAYLGRLRRTLTLMRNGAGAQEAAKASGVFWKQEREFLRQVRAWSLEELDRLQPDVLAADRACKTAGAPDHLIAERLALTIAGRARRLGL
ncbi:MAG: DNA polymerase III subunit delta [Phenylobacterium sp.]|uniref:DNA polymerase III subunit delta n=1 Tax=Phenylobacterium sp. TaxID=1871053 RepID=UPI00391BF768